ncbi:MAG: hypothetical protein AB7U23_15705 [Dehalococcoidia bacterium]
MNGGDANHPFEVARRSRSLLPMDELLRREILVNLHALTAYLERGYELEWMEPPVRGRKGPDRHARRHLGVTLFTPAAFDALRWEATKQALGSGGVSQAVSQSGRRTAPPPDGGGATDRDFVSE